MLLEVLDARDPLGCRCLPLEEAVMQRMEGKRVVLLLNKVDLVPRENAAAWVSYLRQYFPTLPFKASTQSQRHDLGRAGGAGASAGPMGGGQPECYGADQLLQLLKNYSRSLNLKTALTVGIVGYPNVGKSSVINSLKRARAVDVGAAPGVTTAAQTVALDKKVRLMDCPGIVFARARTAEEEVAVLLRNCVRVEKISDPVSAVGGILRRVPHASLAALYGLGELLGASAGEFEGAEMFVTAVAIKRGVLRKGGAVDAESAARVVIRDWNAGAMRYHTEPPKSRATVEIVGAADTAFELGDVPRVESGDGLEAEEEHATVGGGAWSGAWGEGQGEAAAMNTDESVGDGDGGVGLGAGAAGASSSRAAPRSRKQDLTDEHSQYNFQLNKAIKKKARSTRRRKWKESRELAANAMDE